MDKEKKNKTTLIKSEKENQIIWQWNEGSWRKIQEKTKKICNFAAINNNKTGFLNN